MTIAPWMNSLVSIFLASGLGFLGSRYWRTKTNLDEKEKSIAQGHQNALDRITELEKQAALVSAAVIPISTAFQAILIKELTHFHTPEMDALLVKVGPPNMLTPQDRDRLSVMLVERTKDLGDLISPSERDAAAILPIVMKRAQIEQTYLATTAEKLVTIADLLDLNPNNQKRRVGDKP